MIGGALAVGLAADRVIEAAPNPSDSLEPLLGPAVTRPLDGRGYVQLAFFSWAPLVVAAYAVIASSAAATVTRNDALPLVFRIFAGASRLTFSATIVLAVTWPFGLDGHVEASRLIFAPLALLPLALACAGLGFAIAMATRQRGLTVLIVGTETVIVFAINVIADVDGSLDRLRYLSPFHYADVKTVFLEGAGTWHVVLLLFAFGVQIALGIGLQARRRRGV